MATPAPVGEVDALLAEAWALAAGDPAAEARMLTAEAFNGASPIRSPSSSSSARSRSPAASATR